VYNEEENLVRLHDELLGYETKPIYVFGGFGLLSMALAVAAGLQAVNFEIMGMKDFAETPLSLVAVRP
jgi:hypothetical protein